MRDDDYNGISLLTVVGLLVQRAGGTLVVDLSRSDVLDGLSLVGSLRDDGSAVRLQLVRTDDVRAMLDAVPDGPPN